MHLDRVSVVDSHTAGEPTRVIVSGGPVLEQGSLLEYRDRLRSRYDGFRSAVVTEPRGSDVIVGALLCEPSDPSSTAGVIFFNNVGYLGMCGHGTIGVVATLAHLKKIGIGQHKIETPVGIVEGTLHPSGQVTIANVASYRSQHQVSLEVPGFGRFRGDVAWGGNWFFLIDEHGFELTLDNVDSLTGFAWAVKSALTANGITGENGAVIDHVELSAPPSNGRADSRNFVLCPGKAYDRSPCGTGTSAKMACLYADGKLSPGQVWRQEGILGTVFEGVIQVEGGRVLPSITGSAYITAESTLIFDARDPFRYGTCHDARL